MDVENSIVFKLKGSYTKQTKNLFDSLAKFASSQSQIDFHILMNFQGLHFISKGKGSITSNILRFDKAFFQQKFEFEPRKSNTPSGYVVKVDLKDFDFSYKLLDSDLPIEIKFCEEKSKLIISQEKVDNENNSGYSTYKTIFLDALNDTEENLNAISNTFIPVVNFSLILEFPNGNSFLLVDNAFKNLKIDCLYLSFDFTDDEKRFYVENDKETSGELIRVSLNKFKTIKGDNQKYKYSYSTKLIHPALSFLNKNTSIELKIDQNGTLYILSKDNQNTYTETLIAKYAD